VNALDKLNFPHSQIDKAGDALPVVSAILVVRNEEKNIERVIEQLLRQDYPPAKLEIIVVDGQSDDRTADIAESKGNGRVRVMRLTERGRAQGMNRGILAAKGDLIARIDARTSIDPDYLSRCVETLERTGADNVGGVQHPVWKSLRQEAVAAAQSHPFGVGNAEFRLGRVSGFVNSVYLGCFRKSVFDKIGLFDEHSAVISEDSDINYRIRQAGGTVYLNRDIKAYYYPRESFSALWDLYFRYGGANVGVLVKHGRITAWRQGIPALFLLAIASSALLSLLDARCVYLLAAVIASYLSVNIGVALRLAVRKRRPFIAPLISWAFICMHFGHGMGFWKRLVVPEKAGRYWGN